MSGEPAVLAIDQGTTSTRAIVFDSHAEARAMAQAELPQDYPRPGWVEHDPERIWSDTVQVAKAALAQAGDVAAIGLTNQRETTIIWDRTTGAAIHPAIVWQDRRGAELCADFKKEGYESEIQEKTGLVLDPYFSASKIAWILDNVAGARQAAVDGKLAFGTVDSWLLWRLTDGKVHATDVTNAARTLVFDIHRQDWDDDLLALFAIPRALMPEVRDSAGHFGDTPSALFGRPLPITGVAGDQQAATFGQAAFGPGEMKATYGTGCFVVLNTGERAVPSPDRLLTTIAWRIDGRTTYALEGSIFVAGAAVQWLRDELKVIDQAAETETLARGIEDTGGVYFVPAFTGLGAPYWDPSARGAIVGLSRDSAVAEIARAALEAVAYQTRDLMAAFERASGAPPRSLKVDGGLAVNDWAMQFLADILDLTVERPAVTETTALGAAYLAGLHAGVWPDTARIAKNWRLDRRWRAKLAPEARERLYGGWQEALARVRSGAPD